MERNNKVTTLESLEHNIDDLARIVKKGFENIDQRFEKVDGRFESIDQRFEQMDAHFIRIDARLDLLERDVSHIRKHFVSRDEFDSLLFRVEIIEKQLGIKPQ